MKKQNKKVNKFELEKFSVAKLKNLKSINGGNKEVDNPHSVTDSLYENDRKR